ncbi:hypothetical protein NPIL_138041 [Nephila pilipes]|uniref:Uncharacterized protein n=1 Tax=Nephila pilipes TaxID=299642 RepID=A0A8X6MAQ3_NEPPI|nr:hypothetical protein NPIL_138041 [Nephila pilipes]
MIDLLVLFTRALKKPPHEGDMGIIPRFETAKPQTPRDNTPSLLWYCHFHKGDGLIILIHKPGGRHLNITHLSNINNANRIAMPQHNLSVSAH